MLCDWQSAGGPLAGRHPGVRGGWPGWPTLPMVGVERSVWFEGRASCAFLGVAPIRPNLVNSRGAGQSSVSRSRRRRVPGVPGRPGAALGGGTRCSRRHQGQPLCS